LFLLLLSGLIGVSFACGGETVVEKVVEVVVEKTVIVEKQVPGEKVVETVVVEKKVAGEKVVETVVVVATAVPIVQPTPTVIVEEDAPDLDHAQGNLVIAVTNVGSGGGTPDKGVGANCRGMNICENLFQSTPTEWAANLVADSWEFADDQSSLTITLKSGIQFHGGYGELTAEDFKWSFDLANPATNPDSIAGGAQIVSWVGDNPVEVIDTYTAKLTIEQWDPNWNITTLGQLGDDRAKFDLVSKNAFETEGADWNWLNVIGTGPFELVEWKPEESVEVKRVENHWRVTPEVESITMLEIPDEAVRMAALSTGEVDVTVLSPNNRVAMLRKGFLNTGAGAGSFHHISMSGNFWDDKEAKTGDPVPRRGTFKHDLPWIGNPWVPEDGNNPEGMDDMEQARLVRLALSHAIDRDLIVEQLYGGSASPYHIYSYSTTNENYKPEWSFDYDPDLSRELIAEAGYPDGFNVPLFIRAGDDTEPGAAVAGMWRDIGLNVQEYHGDYSVFRPGLIGRTVTMPWIHSAGGGGPQTSMDQPVIGIYSSTVGVGGYNLGVESPYLGKKYLELSSELDPAKRLLIRFDMADYMREQALVLGVVAINNDITYNPGSFASWDMSLTIGEEAFNSVERIKLR
jgi:peptide/nickel transport system substrate-binding protein